MTFPGLIACFSSHRLSLSIESEVVETAATMKYPHLTTTATARNRKQIKIEHFEPHTIQYSFNR